MKRFGIGLVVLFVGLILLAGLVLGGGFLVIRGSLPTLDGSLRVAGVDAPLSLERDSLGTAVVRAAGWRDAHFGLGFAHGQDRFFQMDLARRFTGARLAELVGPDALPSDLEMGAYDYRDAARFHLSTLDPGHRGVLDAYVAGVNAGLASLGRRPPEYLLLRARPAPWTPEDALLLSLYLHHLLSTHHVEERRLLALQRHLPEAVLDFLTPETTRFDRPLPALSPGDPTGGYRPLNPPPPWVLDLRGDTLLDDATLEAAGRAIQLLGDPPAGSNAWATSVEGGPALVAGDPHLPMQIPGTWYRAEMHWPGGTLRGATLPGLPGFLVGMSDHLAWAPTAGQVDQTDLVLVVADPEQPDHYLTAEGPVPFRRWTDSIPVRSQGHRVTTHRSTHWGPVVGETRGDTLLALRSPAYATGGITLEHLEVGRATSVHDAVEIGRRMGGPSLGLVLGDAEGRVAWMITGVIPGREGTDGRTPVEGTRPGVRWTGPLPEEERPVVLDSAGGVVFTANHRFAEAGRSGAFSARWFPPTRALRIHELLEADARPSERLHQGYQLDTRSLEHEFARALVLELVDAEEPDPSLARIREMVEGWSGRADADSAPFRILVAVDRAFRNAALAPLLAPAIRADPGVRYTWPLAQEAAFRILEARPAHLLPPAHESWEAYLRETLEDVVAALTGDPLVEGLAEASGVDGWGLDTPWGEVNRARIRHPFSQVQPALARILDLPADPLPGWLNAVRAQSPTYGQSLRFVGRPGRADDALLDLPGGQSGHVLSRWYTRGHRAWVEGRGLPLAAGPAEHVLELLPREDHDGDPSSGAGEP